MKVLVLALFLSLSSITQAFEVELADHCKASCGCVPCGCAAVQCDRQETAAFHSEETPSNQGVKSSGSTDKALGSP